MKIGELANLAGCPVETIRYYEREGLLPPPLRSEPNNYRRYEQAHLERLAFIRHCRALEMSLADIRQLLQALDTPGAPPQDVDRLMQAQIERVRARLESMRALEKQLLLLQASCNGQHEGQQGCGVLKELVAAAHGEACACHGRIAE